LIIRLSVSAKLTRAVYGALFLVQKLESNSFHQAALYTVGVFVSFRRDEITAPPRTIHANPPHLLVDQGTADPFLESQLMPDRLKQACAAAGVQLTLRYQHGYDHSYFFIASFVEEHLRWHAQRLA
jgi:S-formylglutathione hydrolase FrmB